MRKPTLDLSSQSVMDLSNVQDLPTNPLRFWIDPGEGALPHKVDLNEFSTGGSIDNVAPQARRFWTGDFQGRPQFAKQYAEQMRLLRPGEETATASQAAMRAFFRYLDEIDHHKQVSDVSCVQDGHGIGFQEWLERGNGAQSYYRLLKTAIDRMRELQALPPLFWPARKRNEPIEQEDVDTEGLRRFYHALKDEARDIKEMFREGDLLAACGRDPRGSRAKYGFQAAAWEKRENHAWLIRELTRDRVLNKQEFLEQGGAGLHAANDPTAQKFDGPAYLAPGMTKRGREGFVGKLRWFYPSYHDTAVFLWLFLVGTGWNLATALGLDVSDEKHWVEDHPHKPDFVVLHGFKGRADRHVFALSMREPEWHPYQIVRFMIERTATLRRTVQCNLDEALERQRHQPTADGEAAIAHLQSMVKSPWLYHVVNEVGRVNAFSHDDSAHLNQIARLTAARKNGLLDKHPQLERITTSVARDAWIGHAYVQSGYHVLLTRLASQHSTSRTLKHYLKRRRYRAHSEKQTQLWQDAVFSEIEGGRILDHTRIRILVTKGEITPEQEKRLLDIRQRTRLGLGCLEPTKPPRHIAPDHKKGALCRVQRCTGCSHGVVFNESLPFLARAYAELILIHGQMPLASWNGSSWEDELESLTETLKGFPPEKVQAEVDNWTNKFKNGEVTPNETYPSY